MSTSWCEKYAEDGDRSRGTAEDVFEGNAGEPEEDGDALAELFGDERDEVQDEEEGENLFGDDMERYILKEGITNYPEIL